MCLKLFIYLFSDFNSTDDMSNNNKEIPPLSLQEQSKRELLI